MLNAKRGLFRFLPIVVLATLIAPAAAGSDPAKSADKSTEKAAKPELNSSAAVIWREPTDIKTRDLFYGTGSKDRLPKGKLTFIKEDTNGVNPKFEVRDENGVRWGVKFGNEARPETAATRLVWAVGYFTNEDYYLGEMKVGDLAYIMKRGQQHIKHGTIKGARLKRHEAGVHQIADWGWDNNPFVGTKELDGLKIMMEMVCNVDLKSANQHVYATKDEQKYVAADLGASFGKCGKTMFYSKGNLGDFQSLPLIKTAGPDFIDFYRFKHIPREHAKWIGGYLAQLSDEQISDAFRAAGFSAEEVEGFSKKFREKINELTNL